METKYDVAAQKEWLHGDTDWETKRREEFAPTVKASLGVILVSVIGLHILDHIAMEISRW